MHLQNKIWNLPRFAKSDRAKQTDHFFKSFKYSKMANEIDLRDKRNAKSLRPWQTNVKVFHTLSERCISSPYWLLPKVNMSDTNRWPSCSRHITAHVGWRREAKKKINKGRRQATFNELRFLCGNGNLVWAISTSFQDKRIPEKAIK